MALGEDADILEARLEQLGALAITVTPLDDDPDALFGEPGSPARQVWKDVTVSALFEENVSVTDVISQFMCSCGERVRELSCSLLGDQDWSRVWMTHFKPLRFGANLWVVPAWLDPPEPLAMNVLIEPGMAFGTGTHPTTALCLEWLAQQHAGLKGARVIDYGCGSGILAIAAAKLGAIRVQAVDLDEHALQATAANAVMNSVAHHIDCLTPDAMDASVKADVLVANILLTPLCNLAALLAQYVRPRGQLVLSGLLTEQLDACKEVYSRWFDFDFRRDQDGWGLLAGHRRVDASG